MIPQEKLDWPPAGLRIIRLWQMNADIFGRNAEALSQSFHRGFLENPEQNRAIRLILGSMAG
jgi:hypothetical protein